MNEIKFRALVREMLGAQQDYFKSRKQSDLIKAKDLEKRVRKELEAGPDVAPVLMQSEYAEQMSMLDEANLREQYEENEQ